MNDNKEISDYNLEYCLNFVGSYETMENHPAIIRVETGVTDIKIPLSHSLNQRDVARAIYGITDCSSRKYTGANLFKLLFKWIKRIEIRWETVKKQ